MRQSFRADILDLCNSPPEPDRTGGPEILGEPAGLAILGVLLDLINPRSTEAPDRSTSLLVPEIPEVPGTCLWENMRRQSSSI